MANKRENRMNLAALQRVDSTITKIIDNATQVALYKFSPKKSEWEKTEIEGTLFVYNRSETPRNGFIVMNRLNTTNLVQLLTKELEFQIQTPFLLYRNAKSGDIHGIWFYNQEECGKIGQLVSRLATMATPDRRERAPHVRQRCSSESDSMTKSISKADDAKAIDIVSLLSRAQDEYDKRTKTESHGVAGSKLQEPKVMLEEPCTEGPKSKDIIRPKPVRATNGVISGSSPQHPTLLASTSSVTNLFAQACAKQEPSSAALQNGMTVPSDGNMKKAVKNHLPNPADAAKQQNSGLENSLLRLMSNPANMVEHIERIQMSESAIPSAGPRVRAPSFSGVVRSTSEPDASAQTLEHDLKEKLHLLPKADSVATKQGAGSSPSHSPTVIFNLSPLNASPIPSNHYGSFAAGPCKVPIVPTGLFPSKQSSVRSLPILTPAMFENSLRYSPPQHSLLGAGSFTETLGSSVPTAAGALDGGASTDSRFSQTVTSVVPPPATSVPLLSPMVFASSVNQSAVSAELSLSNSIHCGQGSAPVSLPLLSSTMGSLMHGLPRSDIPSSELLLPQQIEAPMTHNHMKETTLPGVSPLTKDQLKEALVHMLNTDEDFLGKVHEAYLTTLKSRLIHFSS